MDADLNRPALGGAHLIDSAIFGHQWTTDPARAIFSERARVERWVGAVAALGRAQADLGLIPASAASEITALVGREIDLDAVAAQTRATSHSTLGMIRVLQSMLPEAAREHVYSGTTVQDITDTAMVLEMQAVGALLWSGLRTVEAALLDLAEVHRATPMIGRTHGQPGAPITFGFKAATWADEVGRSIARLHEIRDRVLVAQLGGAVGSLGYFGDQALRLRAGFASEVGLREPAISWLTSRDRLAEFASVVGIAVSGLARIANEVYALQRREVGELREATNASAVGSITMPHKRNPESSEQIVVLARLVRSQAAILADTMVQEHERDARGWKAEWAVFPELCHYACAATEMSITLVEGLEVDAVAMQRNIVAMSFAGSEQLLRRLSPQLGKHRAQALLNDAYRRSIATNSSVAAAVVELIDSDDDLDHAEIGDLDDVVIGAAADMADGVIEAARSRRASEPREWR